MSIIKKPWELGEVQASNKFSPFQLPDVCKGKHLLVRIAPPKGKGVRSGLVTTFLMTSYFDESGTEIKLVEAMENTNGYKITFPLGKKGLVATKYRGPTSYYRYLDKESNQFYQIPNDRFTPESAIHYCEENVEGWAKKSDIDKDLCLDEYFQEMFMFGISQDLSLPIEGDSFTQPFVGLQSELYRVYTPPKEGEKYGNIIITKWHRGKPNLDGTFVSQTPELAEAIHMEYQVRDTDEKSFDPTSFVESVDDDEII